MARRGHAYLAAKRGAEAAAETQKILDHRGIVATEHIGALAVAVITNRAAGLSPKLLTHQEVLETSQTASQDLARLISAAMPALTR